MYCTESADCLSDHCSWRFKCYTPKRRWWSSDKAVSESTGQVVEMTGPQSHGAQFGMVAVGFLFLTMKAVTIAYNRFRGRRYGYEEIPTSLTHE